MQHGYFLRRGTELSGEPLVTSGCGWRRCTSSSIGYGKWRILSRKIIGFRTRQLCQKWLKEKGFIGMKFPILCHPFFDWYKIPSIQAVPPVLDWKSGTAHHESPTRLQYSTAFMKGTIGSSTILSAESSAFVVHVHSLRRPACSTKREDVAYTAVDLCASKFTDSSAKICKWPQKLSGNSSVFREVLKAYVLLLKMHFFHVDLDNSLVRDLSPPELFIWNSSCRAFPRVSLFFFSL